MRFSLIPILLSAFASSVIVTYPDSSSFHLPHLTGNFGPSANTYSVSGSLVSDTTLLCSDPSNLSQKYANQIVVVERGACTFTDKALNAQALGALGIIIGGDDNEDTLLYMSGAAGSQNVHVPTIYVSGQSYQKLLQILQNYAFTGSEGLISVTLDSTGESQPNWSPNPPPPTMQPIAPTRDVFPGTGTGTQEPSYPTDPPVSGPYDSEDEMNSSLNIVWIIVGVSVLVKCLIITVACRRRYRSKRVARQATADVVSEGEVNDETPVVYATYPAPSSGFTVSAAQSEEGSLPSVPRDARVSSLSMYPSIQYTPLMPQATAPSDMYAYDLEKQAIVIRG